MKLKVSHEPYCRRVEYLAGELLACRTCGVGGLEQLFFCSGVKALFCAAHAGSLAGCRAEGVVEDEHQDWKVDAFKVGE